MIVLLALLVLPSPPADAAPDAAMGGTVSAAPTGLPVSGVCVVVLDLLGGSRREVATDPLGRWSVSGLEPGPYVVAFNGLCDQPRPGYAYEYFDDTRIATSPLLLADGEQRTHVDARLDPSATIRGAADDAASGRAEPGLCVVAVEADRAAASGDESDDSGYAIVNLPPGTYDLVVLDCRAPFTHRFGSVATGVSVAAGDDRQVDAVATEGSEVRGLVTARHTGRPINGVCVRAGSADGFDAALGITGVDGPNGLFGAPQPTPGRYVAPGAPVGPVEVSLNDPVCGDDGYDVVHRPVTTTTGGTAFVDAELAPRASNLFLYACRSGSGGSGFPDVTSENVHWTAIDCMADFGVVRGRGDGTYGASAPTTRDQMASVVARALAVMGATLPAGPPDAFDDDAGNEHERAINQLAALGVVSGTAPRRYTPAALVTRGQMATFLVRAYEAATGFTLRPADDPFADDDGSVHEPAIEKSANAGFTAGSAAGAFTPTAAVARDQLATFLARTVDRAERDRFGFG